MQPIEYTVKQITGDYAYLADPAGNDILVALALLPDGIDEGDRLLYENMEYTVL